MSRRYTRSAGLSRRNVKAFYPVARINYTELQLLVAEWRGRGSGGHRLELVGMAERVGFEPTVPVKVQQFSRLPDSTTLAPLRYGRSSVGVMIEQAG